MLNEILKDKYQQNKLAHLYLVEPQFAEGNFATQFLKELSLLTSVENVGEHHDTLILPKPEKKQYMLEDIERIYQFIRHPAIELSRKFIIIEAVDKLSTMQSNKLLKELEEPSINLTFFLLNPTKTKLLATLNSRAILLRWKAIDYPINTSPQLNNEPELETFIESNLKSWEDIVLYSKTVLTFASFYVEDPKLFSEVQRCLSSIEKDREFNNPLQQAQLKLFHLNSKLLKINIT